MSETLLPRLRSLALFLLLFAVMFWVASFRLDPDFGWHLKAGQYYLQHGIPAHDVFTYTARDFPWINHEWLNDVIVARLFGWGGYELVAAVFAGLWTTALWLAARQRYRLPLILAAAAALPYAGIRPVAWSVLLFAILVRLVEAKHLKSIPLLFVAWANLHGGFVVGLAVLGLWWLIRRRWYWVVVLCAAVAATLINPYGPRLYIEVYRTLADSSLHRYISEWRPLYFPYSTWPYFVVLPALFWVFWSRRFSAKLAIPASMLALAFTSTRHVPFAVAGTLSLFEGQWHGALVEFKKTTGARRNVLVLAGAVTVVSVGWLFFQQMNSVNREANYPSESVAYLQQHPCSGNLFNAYDFGGYVIWKLGVPVYIDGRMPSWKASSSESYFENYRKVLDDAGFRAQQFQRYNITCALLKGSPDTSFSKKLQGEGWHPVTDEADAQLLLRP